MSSQKRPPPVAKILDPKKPNIQRILAIIFLSKWNLSIKAELKASIIDMEDERPATKSVVKNRTPKK